eukprot:TRINITY_DN1339_c0_g2_i1.p1 TRINITY_DN1339_c0_g2~~TRINITY_DN1339_c0_g2_i1.p1  ORF type:complete len:848 (+),score=162.05 TRINITY_DN1339_c0_g2_i1:177-2720(+)
MQKTRRRRSYGGYTPHSAREVTSRPEAVRIATGGQCSPTAIVSPRLRTCREVQESTQDGSGLAALARSAAGGRRGVAEEVAAETRPRHSAFAADAAMKQRRRSAFAGVGSPPPPLLKSSWRFTANGGVESPLCRSPADARSPADTKASFGFDEQTVLATLGPTAASQAAAASAAGLAAATKSSQDERRPQALQPADRKAPPAAAGSMSGAIERGSPRLSRAQSAQRCRANTEPQRALSADPRRRRRFSEHANLPRQEEVPCAEEQIQEDAYESEAPSKLEPPAVALDLAATATTGAPTSEVADAGHRLPHTQAQQAWAEAAAPRRESVAPPAPRPPTSVAAALSAAASSLRRPPPFKALPSAVFGGQYTTGRYLGRGASASVWEAVHADSQLRVAIKVFDQGARDRRQATREMKVLSRIKHPRILEAFEVVESSLYSQLVCELVDGESLRAYAQKQPGNRLRENAARRFYQQVVDGVGYCHDRFVVHRDLKLENLLLDKSQDNVKIIDFGFAAQTASKDAKLKAFCGTPSYMAPEILRGEGYSGFAADVWALGVVIFTLLCGILPFTGRTEMQLYAKIRRGVFACPDILGELPRRLVRSCMKMDASTRPSASSLLRHAWMLGDAATPSSASTAISGNLSVGGSSPSSTSRNNLQPASGGWQPFVPAALAATGASEAPRADAQSNFASALGCTSPTAGGSSPSSTGERQRRTSSSMSNVGLGCSALSPQQPGATSPAGGAATKSPPSRFFPATVGLSDRPDSGAPPGTVGVSQGGADENTPVGSASPTGGRFEAKGLVVRRPSFDEKHMPRIRLAQRELCEANHTLTRQPSFSTRPFRCTPGTAFGGS